MQPCASSVHPLSGRPLSSVPPREGWWAHPPPPPPSLLCTMVTKQHLRRCSGYRRVACHTRMPSRRCGTGSVRHSRRVGTLRHKRGWCWARALQERSHGHWGQPLQRQSMLHTHNTVAGVLSLQPIRAQVQRVLSQLPPAALLSACLHRCSLINTAPMRLCRHKWLSSSSSCAPCLARGASHLMTAPQLPPPQLATCLQRRSPWSA